MKKPGKNQLPRRESKKKQKGSFFILVLWTLSLLTVFAVYLGFNVQQKLIFLDRLERRNKLYLIAEAGVKKAIAEVGRIPLTGSALALKDRWSNNQEAFFQVPIGEGSFTVGYNYQEEDFCAKAQAEEAVAMRFGLEDEESKININTADRAELGRLIKQVTGFDEERADILASSIIDWRDEDNLSLPNGAEDEYYRSLKWPYECKDFPFQTTEELRYVKQMNSDIFKKIEPYITIYGSGTVNINTASRNILSALGLGSELIEKIMQFRQGEDKELATDDDQIFTDVTSIVACLSQVYSSSPSETAQLSNLVSAGKLSTSSNTFSVQSTAMLKQKEAKCLIRCVLRKNMEPEAKKAAWILSWQHKYFN